LGFFFADDAPKFPDIRWMNRDHLSQVLAIDRAGFPHRHDPPWPYSAFAAILAEHTAAGIVWASGDSVQGFLVYEFWSGHILITRLCVKPSRRRQGVGTALLGRIEGKLADGFHNRLVVHTHERNSVAHAFLARAGFKATLARDHYKHPTADSYLFSRGIGVAGAVGAGRGR